MPLKQQFREAISSVQWDQNVKSILASDELVDSIASCNYKLALWSKQVENADGDNPAVAFIREMQAAGHNVSVLICLGLYKPAAASMRTILETALFYTYFRHHHCELATLVREESYYLQRAEIVDYHKLHTANFSYYEQAFGLLGKMNSWYKKVSSIIHSQKPGGWTAHKGISEIKHSTKLLPEVIYNFHECVDIVHALFFCTVGKELWDSFTPTAKKKLLYGISGEIKAKIGLDVA